MNAAKVSRRDFLRIGGSAGVGLVLIGQVGGRWFEIPIAEAAIPGGTLDPVDVPKFVTPLLIPPVMPRAGTIRGRGGKNVDYYEISMRQFSQQILPAGFGATTVWGYGAVTGAGQQPLLLHNAPSLTIEAKWNRPVRVKWINDLVDADGGYLPHLLPVDPTLHWANPPGGATGRDARAHFTETPGRYTGPVPIVTHVHGSVAVGDESDGYPEAWYLPAADDISDGYATEGTWYQFFADKAMTRYGAQWGPGFATFEYPNSQRASTIWYHDHSLGLTRLNVYAGPAGFFIIRGGPEGDDAVRDTRSREIAALPGPAPREGDKVPPNKPYREIAMAIQDRSFHADGSLFYPDNRAFFDEVVGPFIGDADHVLDGDEHAELFSPIWNPEFFGNTIMVNGNTWPYLTVEQRRYRFRFLNGCQSRFLILNFAEIPGVEVWQIGSEGGFLAAPVDISALGGALPMNVAERADVIVDFTDVAVGSYVLGNLGPDEPYGGGTPGDDFESADPVTTGKVLQFVVTPADEPDTTTPPRFLQLPPVVPLPQEVVVRPLALIEQMGKGYDADGAMIDGPFEALLGTVDAGTPIGLEWSDAVTENPNVGDVELWEFYNTTGDAHPIHVHEVLFQVVNRQALLLNDDDEPAQPLTLTDEITQAAPWEHGWKDTVTAFPGQVTRVKMRFTSAGQYVWHCHIVEHEDNEMMRPYRIGPEQPGEPL
jgi:spore coat protein A